MNKISGRSPRQEFSFVQFIGPPNGKGLAVDPIQKRMGANLPHWTRNASAYAVTFRLADSLPAGILQKWKTELGMLQTKSSRDNKSLTIIEKKRLQQLLSVRVQAFLDSGAGLCWLAKPTAAQQVRNCLAHFHGDQYWIYAWCIMPNHVHAVLQVAPERSLSKILQAWKSNSSRRIGRLLSVRQPFWQAESYDHLIRDGQDLDHAVAYVLNNPVKAGFTHWPWVGRMFSP